jgi:hypothetical protein
MGKFSKYSAFTWIIVSVCLIAICAIFAWQLLDTGYQTTDTTCVVTSTPTLQTETYERPNCKGMPPYTDTTAYFAFANVTYTVCGRVYNGILQISDGAKEFAQNATIGDSGPCYLQYGFPNLIPGSIEKWSLGFGYTYVGLSAVYLILAILWFIARCRMGCGKRAEYNPIN